MNTIVKFYETVDDSLLKFAVIVAKSNGKWVFCKHKERDTYECPGGHREAGETIDDTAKRELNEETGAIYNAYSTFDTVISRYSAGKWTGYAQGNRFSCDKSTAKNHPIHGWFLYL